MCGIAGIIDSNIASEQRLSLLTKMLEAIKHRGPDATNHFHDGHVSLGHNRLSIIDLSSESDQPFIKENLVLVFNGEIYNYKELRIDLQKLGAVFTTNGDTEVLMEGYRIWGEKVLDRLLGMFAFVFYDKINGNIFGARDRFGIKPFHYILKGSTFSFASEVKALRVLPHYNSTLNADQVNLYLNLGWLYNGQQTLHEDVKNISPGQKFTLINGEFKTTYYYQLEPSKDHLSDDATIEKFEEILADSLKIHLRTDVEIGALLSGGIDSSAIVSYVLKHKFAEKLNTFSIYYGEDKFDERPFIQEVTNQYKDSIASTLLSPQESSVANELERINHIQDFPIIGSSAISQYFIMEAVSKQGIKVVLSGQGADDFLGGYMHSYYRYYSGLIKQFHLLKFYKEFRYQKKYQGLSTKDVLAVLSKSMLSLVMSESNLYKLELNHFNPRVLEHKSNTSIDLKKAKEFGDLNGFLYALMTKSNLPNLLHLEDRNSMAFSLESRVPFLDHRLVEWGINARPELKIKDGLTKYILREACKETLPPKIYNRKDKKGFVTPGEVQWLRGDLKFLLDSMENYPVEMSNKRLNAIIEEFKSGKNTNANFIWRIAMLKYWYGKL